MKSATFGWLWKCSPQRRTLIGLLDLYGVEDPQRSEILALSKQADEQGWLRPYHADLPDEYTAYISFEAEGRGVRNYESSFVPGLLQTEDYARAVIRGVLPTATAKEVDQRVRARIERQHVFTKERPLELWAILDEAALRRLVGAADVMTAQLEHLLAMTELPNVTLQAIPSDLRSPARHGAQSRRLPCTDHHIGARDHTMRRRGMEPVEREPAQWRTSSYSSGNGQCVEVALTRESTAIRDSKDPAGPALVVSAVAWKAFVGSVAVGEFDQA